MVVGCRPLDWSEHPIYSIQYLVRKPPSGAEQDQERAAAEPGGERGVVDGAIGVVRARRGGDERRPLTERPFGGEHRFLDGGDDLDGGERLAAEIVRGRAS